MKADIYAAEQYGSTAQMPVGEWGYIWGKDFVTEFGSIWLKSPGSLSLTSYLRDRRKFPGFWEHDMRIFLNVHGVQDRTVKNTLAKSGDHG